MCTQKEREERERERERERDRERERKQQLMQQAASSQITTSVDTVSIDSGKS